MVQVLTDLNYGCAVDRLREQACARLAPGLECTTGGVEVERALAPTAVWVGAHGGALPHQRLDAAFGGSGCDTSSGLPVGERVVAPAAGILGSRLVQEEVAPKAVGGAVAAPGPVTRPLHVSDDWDVGLRCRRREPVPEAWTRSAVGVAGRLGRGDPYAASWQLPAAELWAGSVPRQPVAGTVRVRVSVCQHCDTGLRWEPGAYCAVCDLCMMTTVCPIRQVEQPELGLEVVSEGGERVWGLGTAAAGRLLAVSDFMYATVRADPLSEGHVLVSRGSKFVARMAAARARWLRATLLRRWEQVAPLGMRQPVWNEGEVSAYVLAWAVSNSSAQLWPAVPAQRFCGDKHVFPPFVGVLYEPGVWVPARLPRVVDPHEFDGSVSAYQPPPEHLRGSIRHDVYAELLPCHPLTGVMHNRLKFGFPQQSSTPLQPRQAPHTPAVGPGGDAARRFLEEELEFGAVAEVTGEVGLCLRKALFYLIEKDGGGQRGILDLSSGEGSVNDSVHRIPGLRARFASLHRILARVVYLQRKCPGRKVVLWKVDASKAFRRVPLAVAEYHRAAHGLGQRMFLDTRLAMGGVASVDYTTESLGMLCDLMAQLGVFACVWVDDVIGVGYEDEAEGHLQAMLALWDAVNWPYGPHKVVQPSTQVVVLGVAVDTVEGTAQLTEERREKVFLRICEWLAPGACMAPRDYSKLAGVLEWCAVLVPQAKVYLRHLYEGASAEGGGRDQRAAVPERVRRDLLRLQALLLDHTAVARFGGEVPLAELHVWTDASGHGYGAVCMEREEVLRGEWAQQERSDSVVAHWEAAAIVMAVGVWGAAVQGGRIVVHTDSDACARGFVRARCPDDRLYNLLRLLCELQMHHRCEVQLRWTAGKLNVVADALSRGKEPPAPYNSWEEVAVPLQLRELGGTLCGKWSPQGSPVQGAVRRQWGTFVDIAKSVGTASLLPLHWTPWKLQALLERQHSLGDSSMSPPGSSTRALSWRGSPLVSTSVLSGTLALSSTTGSSSIPLPRTPICTAISSSPGTSASASQPRSDSCALSVTTPPSTSGSRRLYWWLTQRSCASVSTLRRQQRRCLIKRLCEWGMSALTGGPGQWPCASRTARLTGTTPVRRYTLCQLLPPGIALFEPCASSWTRTRAAAIPARLSSSRLARAARRASRQWTSRARCARMRALLDLIPSWCARTASGLGVRSRWPTPA